MLRTLRGDDIHVALTLTFPGPTRRAATLVTLSDVTERKRREQERERILRELAEAVRARDELLSVASHELKTPLTPF